MSDKSKGMSISPCDNTLPATVQYPGETMYVEFDGGGLKQDKIAFEITYIVFTS